MIEKSSFAMSHEPYDKFLHRVIMAENSTMILGHAAVYD